ncbi:MAG: DUF928 domain-containing protein [Elainellaceae cyanobacterium]
MNPSMCRLLMSVGSLLLIPALVSGVAMAMANEAIAQAIPDEAQEAEGDRLFQEGMELRQAEQLEVALEKFEAALRVYEERGDRQGQADTLNQIGNIYLSLNQHEQALEFFQQALTLRQTEGQSLSASPSSTLAEASSTLPDRHVSFSLPTFQPPDILMPGSGESGGIASDSEDDGTQVDPPQEDLPLVTALVPPETNHGYTLSPKPTIFVSLTEEIINVELFGDLTIQFGLWDEQGRFLYKLTQPYPEETGVLGVDLEGIEDLPALEIGKTYYWIFWVAGVEDWSSSHYTNGWIQRLEPLPYDLQEIETSIIDQPYTYAEEGIWYDSLAAFFKLSQRSSSSFIAIEDLQALLISVGLESIREESFIGYWSRLSSFNSYGTGTIFYEEENTPNDSEFEPLEIMSSEDEDNLPIRNGGRSGYSPPDIGLPGRTEGRGTR